jgi:hypothetical protein
MTIEADLRERSLGVVKKLFGAGATKWLDRPSVKVGYSSVDAWIKEPQ